MIFIDRVKHLIFGHQAVEIIDFKEVVYGVFDATYRCSCLKRCIYTHRTYDHDLADWMRHYSERFK